MFVTKIGKHVKIRLVDKRDLKTGLDHDKGVETGVVSLFFDTDNLFRFFFPQGMLHEFRFLKQGFIFTYLQMLICLNSSKAQTQTLKAPLNSELDPVVR